MKANELMIGDWVYWNGFTVRIDAIDITKELDRYTKPIPLTPEILEKNGGRVKNMRNGYDEWWIELERHYSWWLLNITKEVDESYEYNIDSFPIHYVHELQHALRLCGLEELADNFQI